MRPWGALALALLGSPLPAAGLAVEPYRANGWARALDVPARTELTVRPEELPGVCDLFHRIDALRVRANRRARAHAFWLGLTKTRESAPSDAAIRFELVWQGRRYPFDRWGCLAVDRRFVRPEEGELISRFETFYRDHVVASPLGRDLNACPQVRPEPGAGTPPTFAGFEDDRYQQHDALIARLVRDFNANRQAWAGAAEGAKPNIPRLSPALVKSLMIEESGGNGPQSRAAWACDPLQVNVPGDWSEAKAELGLSPPATRNEGSVENNLRAGIQYLVRKGFGVSGQAISRRPGAYFDSWRVALQRYNGRTDPVRDGRPYRAAYAERILRRARNPRVFVPIALEHGHE